MNPPAAHHLQVGFEKSSFIALQNNVATDFFGALSAANYSCSVLGLLYLPLFGL